MGGRLWCYTQPPGKLFQCDFVKAVKHGNNAAYAYGGRLLGLDWNRLVQ